MNDTNYIGGIIKILETPKQKVLQNNKLVVNFRGQLSQIRKNKTIVVNLVAWGNLARDIKKYYKTNDYVLIEGFIKLQKQINSKTRKQTITKVEVTILKIYPFLSSSRNSIEKN